MFPPDAKVLVAVSGGKDSLALWDVLVDLGYAADGLYLGLGIGEYSSESAEITRAFAARRGVSFGPHWWHVSAYADYDLETARGLGLTTVFVERPHARPGRAEIRVRDLGELARRAEGEA